MRAWVSLWSADPLALGRDVDRLAAVADGFHVDVVDGHFAPHLLFGPDTVRALAARAAGPVIDVHLMVADADAWIDPFADAGAGLITVHAQTCADPRATLGRIAARGVRPGLALGLEDPVELAVGLLGHVRRVLVMGTALGVKGAGLDSRTPARVRALVSAAAAADVEIVVDGGIRPGTVGALAAAGADGVVPGSLVFGAEDPVEAVRALHRL